VATVAGLALLLPLDKGRAQGPAGQREAIAVPVVPSGSGQSTAPSSTQELFQPKTPVAPQTQYPPTSAFTSGLTGSSYTPGDNEQPHTLREYLSQNLDDVDMNNDIAVQPQFGDFMICINWYSGAEAPKSARALALELRGTDYNLKAYVFTKGVEERRKALQEIFENVQKQKEELAKRNLPMDSHIRVPLIRYEIQCAVLVGGYKDMESAHRDLEKFKNYSADKLKEKNIPLHAIMGDVKYDDKGQPCSGRMGLVTPSRMHWSSAIPASRAPSDPRGFRRKIWPLLRAFNEDEPFSLLKCPKAYTLAVKKFSMPAEHRIEEVVQLHARKNWSGRLRRQGRRRQGQRPQPGQILNANRIIEQAHLRAWVLHTKYCSYVRWVPSTGRTIRKSDSIRSNCRH